MPETRTAEDFAAAPDAADLLDALRKIAEFPHAPANRDLTFSEAVAAMAKIAADALAKAGA